MAGSALPQPQPIPRVGHTPCHVITTAASLRLAHFLRHRLRLSLRLGPSFKDLWGNSSRFEGVNVLQSFRNSISTASSCYMGIFGGSGNTNSSLGKSELNTRRSNLFDDRGCTNTLLIINVLAFIAQFATKGKLLLLGAKINSLIDQGQLWRLATSSLLHANIGHLMINCYSLNSIGPAVEKISGPRRYLAIYFASAVTGCAMSYWLSKAPAIGASGAIFGLVGSFAVFILRHRTLIKDANSDLQHIARVIALNMAIGLMSKGIDNWAHLGGLLGGAATSWLIGPAWKYESLTTDGRKVFNDRAPIFSIIKAKRMH